MKSLSLLLLRFSTGSYLIFWGLVKILSKERAVALSDRFYGGLVSADITNYALAAGEILVGALVILGLLRRVVYPIQAIIYFAGMAAIWQYILDPFGAYLADAARLTFYPSTTLFFASLVMLAFQEDDTRSLDARRG